jgi:hypothetical protein
MQKTKPKIRKNGNFWLCDTNYPVIRKLGERIIFDFSPIGIGRTPSIAYHNWKAQMGL